MNDANITIEALYEFEGGAAPMGYFTRGHIDPALFLLAVSDLYDIGVERLTALHAYWHNIPGGPDNPDMSYVREMSRPGRGTYAVTVVYL